MPLNWTGTQPLGLQELEENAAVRYKPQARDSLIRNDEIRSCVRGSHRWLAKRRWGASDPKSFCPEHEISVSTSPTYIYKDYQRNIVIDASMLQRVKGLKVESWRLGNERNEDALSWNFFVGLAGLTGLGSAFQRLTGIEVDVEPESYLWGVRISNEKPVVWDSLLRVRGDLKETRLPTEPDIMLRVPRRAIVLIEAKFGSPNGTLVRNDNVSGPFLTSSIGIRPLQGRLIPSTGLGSRTNLVIRSYNSSYGTSLSQRLGGDVKDRFVVNLVRNAEEPKIGKQINDHFVSDGPVCFRTYTWETLFQLPVLCREDAKPLSRYLEDKTNGLVKAFNLNLGSIQ